MSELALGPIGPAATRARDELEIGAKSVDENNVDGTRIATSNDKGHDRHKYRDHSEAFPGPARNFSAPQVNQRRSAQSRQSFKMLSPVEPSRQRNHFKSFCRHISLYESLHVAMREQQRRNWRHDSAAESGVDGGRSTAPVGRRKEAAER